MSSSKQLNFFIVNEDWASIGSLFSGMDVLFIKVPFKDMSKILSTDIGTKGEESYIVYLTKEKFFDRIEFRNDTDGYNVDVIRSYAIEFNRGGFYPYSNKILHRARFYAITSFKDENNISIKKDSEFVEWVNTIFKSFKKHFLTESPLDKDFPFSLRTIEWATRMGAKMDAAGLTISY
jgi:hypothetical protein